MGGEETNGTTTQQPFIVLFQIGEGGRSLRWRRWKRQYRPDVCEGMGATSYRQQANGHWRMRWCHTTFIKLEPEAKAYKKQSKSKKCHQGYWEKRRRWANLHSLVWRQWKFRVLTQPSAFASDGATLNAALDRSESRSCVRRMYSRFSQLKTEKARTKYVSNAIEHTLSDPSQIEMPKTFEEAAVLLKVQIISKTMCVGQTNCVPHLKILAAESPNNSRSFFCAKTQGKVLTSWRSRL